MTTRVTRVALIGWLVVSGVLHAQSSPSGQLSGLASRYVDANAGLDLDRAVALALEQEPALRAARSDADIARGMRLQADLRPNPTVSLSYQGQPSGTDNQTRMDLVWPLDLHRKDGRIGVAEREIEVTRHALADRERILAADVRMKYGDASAAARELSVLDELVAAVAKQHAIVAARVEEGSSPPLERDVLRVELRRLESERLLASGTVERALIDLKRSIGLSPDASLKIRDDLERLVQREVGVVPPADTPGLTRPDVEAASARVLVADAAIDRARRDGRFDVSLFGSYMRVDAGFPQQGFGSGGLEPIRDVFHYVAGGASIMLPFRNDNRGAVAVAEAQRVAAASALDAARLAAQAEVAAARVRDEYAQQALTIYATDVRTLARQNLVVVSQTYELGRATVFDLLAEERRYLEIERGMTSALREAYAARQALRQALGAVR